jgi:hypothetical protein
MKQALLAVGIATMLLGVGLGYWQGWNRGYGHGYFAGFPFERGNNKMLAETATTNKVNLAFF